MFVTIDMELADRILSSFCSISILYWENGEIIKEFHTLINPDCEVEEFFKDRHGLTDEELSQAPTLPYVWKEIYDLLENKMVFAYDANRVMKTLINRAEVDVLNVPNFDYGNVQSIVKRTWKGLDDYRLQNITEKLNITKIHNDSYEDAKSLGKLIYKATEELELEKPEELFHQIGYAGGYIRNNKKYCYRAKKNKKTKTFYADLIDKDAINIVHRKS